MAAARAWLTRPHTLHTTLNPAQAAVVLILRESLLLPLDNLLAITHEFLNPAVSRSGLSRCLRRHGVSRLNDLRIREYGPNTPALKTFKDYASGLVHVDVKYPDAGWGSAPVPVCRD